MRYKTIYRLYSQSINILDLGDWQEGEGAHKRTPNGPCSSQERVTANEGKAVGKWPEGGQAKANAENLTMEVRLDLEKLVNVMAPKQNFSDSRVPREFQ